jgi:formylglycine-generating enzyme required for sulfatase activity
LPPGAPFVIRSDCEHLTFGLITRPDWATAIGRDRHGLWTRFEVKGERGRTVSQRMRWIPPGRFTMGSPPDEPGRFEYEGPAHQVTIASGFWCFDTPTTQAMWQAVMNRNPSEFKSPDRPVDSVSWNDCKAFLEKINGQPGVPQLALPTEAEWEYACRAGTRTALYAGPIDILGENNAPALDPIAWYGGNSAHGFELKKGYDSKGWPEKQYPHSKAGSMPVAQKAANDWGLYDMLGNVWEWVADERHPNYECAPSDGSAWLEGEGGAKRVLRGGSWGFDARLCRSAARFWSVPGDRFDFFGFRPVARVQA